MNKIKLSLLISTLFISISCFSLESDYSQPIHVSSGSQHAKLKKNTVVFLDNVLLTQGSIKIIADKITVIRGEKPNHEIMIADGDLATLYQTQDDGKPFDAQANSIRYDVAKGAITLQGNAQVKQLDSQINGATIIYYLKTEELTVNTDDSKDARVTSVFLPAQFEKEKTPHRENSSEDKK